LEELQLRKIVLTQSQQIAHIGSWKLDLVENQLIWSDETYRIFGVEPQEFAPTYEAFLEFIHPEDRSAVNAAYSTSVSDGKDSYEIEHRVVKKNTGEIRFVYEKCIHERDTEGVIIRSIGIVQDITDRKNAEEALIESEEKYRKLVNLVQGGIWVIDKHNTTSFVNSSMARMLGYPADEMHGKSLFDFMDETGIKIANENIERRQAGIQEQHDFEFICKNGDRMIASLQTAPIMDKSGNYDGAIAAVMNITERKLAETELVKAKEKAEESDRLKSAFLTNMSHEIRTPMNGILGFAGLLKEPNLTGEEQQNYIRIIEKSGARMLNIINDIVSISKIEAGLMEVNIQESNINEQIEYIYTFFKPEIEAKGIQFSFKNSLPSKEAILKTDRENVYAILTNLVKNAIKYSEKGTIEFGYNLKGRYLEFFVRDTGIGIPKDRQKAIFERFIQADIEDKMARQGAGLGLSISKAYVEMLGGKIWVESEEGIGSTFYFTLPYTSEKMKEKNAKNEDLTPAEVNPINKLKILIAEDDEVSEELISIAVQKFGKEIISVRTGKEAVEACLNNPDIDLVLMDILMPEMDGHEATSQIRKFNKDVIIIAQTAYAIEGDKEKALKAGCNDYISKPINKHKLLALIQKYFNK
jgi:PAS domain S-box-containing protein